MQTDQADAYRRNHSEALRAADQRDTIEAACLAAELVVSVVSVTQSHARVPVVERTPEWLRTHVVILDYDLRALNERLANTDTWAALCKANRHPVEHAGAVGENWCHVVYRHGQRVLWGILQHFDRQVAAGYIAGDVEWPDLSELSGAVELGVILESLAELSEIDAARLRIELRKEWQRAKPVEPRTRFLGLKIDAENRTVYRDGFPGDKAEFTNKDVLWRFFKCLYDAGTGRVTRTALLDAVWLGEPVSDNSVDQAKRRLRDITKAIRIKADRDQDGWFLSEF